MLEILLGSGFEIGGGGWVREEESENGRIGVGVVVVSMDGVAEEGGDVGRYNGIGRRVLKKEGKHRGVVAFDDRREELLGVGE